LRISSTPDYAIKARKNSIPFSATIELTYKCNLSCIHCYLAPFHEQEQSIDGWYSVIGQLNNCGTMELAFTGGEALLHPNFFELAEYGRRLNMALSLLSNGTLINNDIAAKIAQLNFKQVFITLFGMKTHDHITRSPGSLEKAIAGVEYLRERGVRVSIKTPVLTTNIHDLTDLGEWCLQRDIDFLPNPSLSINDNGSQCPLHYRIDRQEDIENYLRLRKSQNEPLPGFHGMCNAGSSVVAISPTGDVFPCVALRVPMGNLQERKLLEIWQASSYLKRLRSLKLADFKQCFICTNRGYCYLCPGETLGEEGDLTVAHEFSCRLASLRRQLYQEEIE